MTIILIEIGDTRYRSQHCIYQFDRKFKTFFWNVFSFLTEFLYTYDFYICLPWTISNISIEYFLSNCISCVGSHCFKSLRKFEFRTIEPERYRIEWEKKKHDHIRQSIRYLDFCVVVVIVSIVVMYHVVSSWFLQSYNIIIIIVLSSVNEDTMRLDVTGGKAS